MKASTCLLVASIFILNETSLANPQELTPSSGVALYNQLKLDAAFPVLEKEASSGNSDSQYYLGEALRKRNRYMTPEAQHWYETAAMNGSIYAMIRLGRKNEDLCSSMDNCPASAKSPVEWFTHAKELLLEKSNDGDPESLYLMYEITLDREWLERSATAGFPLAQYWMAVSERQGEGFFFIPGKRDASVRKWLLLSSEGGYPKAMMDYLEILHTEGDTESIRHWLELAAETGYQAAISSYGAYISHTPDKVGYPLDIVKGYALYSLLKELDGGGGIKRFVEKKLDSISEKMTQEQIEQSKIVAKQWKATHPPLSFFPDKLGN
ncbi:tetratricopeptide repeat protein [Pseudomonas koreensis]|uniref:Sel1 repeat family protein n=1 Tax=Pseudomonas koreensis TaxID=198620 RepID=A0A9X3BE29_9PSED|nr:sel1 repeat family protein [Pseudomonas koreensis]MCU7251300.1 sel1 repeat family protein [Pseudomonas koreensis]